MGKRTAVTSGEVSFVPLTQGQVAIIDSDDLPLVSEGSWSAKRNRSTFYAARRRGRGPLVLMHRVIMGLVPGEQGPDHIDGNGLNNRRSNLRMANASENVANSGPRPGSSQFKGVCWVKRESRWLATITVGGRQRYIGRFRHEVDAARAYDAAALEAWGEYAYQNLPDPGSLT